MFLHQLIKVFLILVLCLPPSSFTLSLKIKKDLTLRTDEDYETESGPLSGRPVGILPKGSVVDIPDKYVIKDRRGKVDVESTLIQWLDEEVKHFWRPDEQLYLHYVPVKIVHPKLEDSLKDKQLYTNIQALRLLKNNSNLMEVIEPAELLEITRSNEGGTEAGFCVSNCNVMDEPTQMANDIVVLLRDLSENKVGLAHRKAALEQRRLLRGVKSVNSNLQNHCGGLSKNQLCSEINKRIKSSNVPFKNYELIGLVIKESSANCKAIGTINASTKNCVKCSKQSDCTKNKKTENKICAINTACRGSSYVCSPFRDHGLFQINDINLLADQCLKTEYYRENGRSRKRIVERSNCSKKARYCSNREFRRKTAESKKAKDSTAFWRSQKPPKCFRNPMYNMEKAFKVLREAQREVRRHFSNINEHPELLRRMILSGYNGGVGHIRNAKHDLELFNENLQKRLSEQGVDITRSNRDIRQIKEEIAYFDDGIDQLQTQTDNLRAEIKSNRNLIHAINDDIRQADVRMANFRKQITNRTSNLSSTEEKKAERLQAITEDAERQLAQVVSERQNNLQRIQQENQKKVSEEVDRNIEKVRRLTEQWNSLNRTDIALNDTQKTITNFLDDHLSDVRQKKLQDGLTDSSFQQLRRQEQTLQRIVQEVNGEKWPYFMDSIINSKSAKERADSIFSSLKQRMDDRERSWDIYNIKKLELELENYRNQLVYISKNPKYKDQLPKVNDKIRSIRAELKSASEQRTKDMQWIVSKNYNESPDGQARALEILSAEIARLAYTENANRNQAKAKERAKVEKEGDFWDKLVYEVKDFFNFSDWFTSDSQEMTALKNLRKDLSKQRIEQGAFLREIFNKPSGADDRSSSWLSVLNQWDTAKSKIAGERQKLENNETLQSVRPYLDKESQEGSIVDFTPGSKLRSRFRTQAMRRHAPSLRSMRNRYMELAKTKTDSIKQEEKERKQRVDRVMDNEIRKWQRDKKNFTLLLTETEDLLAQNQSMLEQHTAENKILLMNRIETIEQKSIKQQQREQVLDQLAARRKDPYDWGDLKIFYFASHLRNKLDTAGLRSRRAERNVLINLSYVDSLLGAEGVKGFANTDGGKRACSSR